VVVRPKNLQKSLTVCDGKTQFQVTRFIPEKTADATANPNNRGESRFISPGLMEL
jgi:hypothetical protein